jgi:tRNA A-37 threonylcarbamoyl transferase component Bud32
MRVHLDKYQSAHKSMQWQSILLVGFGGVGVMVTSFLLFLGVLLWVFPDGGMWERRAGVTVGVFFGFLPLVVSVAMVWRGVTWRLAFRRVRDLAAFARTTPSFVSQDAARALTLSPLDVERAILDATALGILENDAPALGAAPVPYTLPSYRLGPASDAPSTNPDSWVGSVLNGTYRIEERLGAGGMGAVYAARHLRTGRRYAVKALLPDARISPDALKRFEREATAASALGHPNIIGVHDFHESGGTHYLVMDLVNGETLDKRLTRVGSIPFLEARQIALDLASGLAAAHDAGLLHRDLKPANVFLASQPSGGDRAIVLDFGLVKPMDDAVVSRITVSGAAVGTPMYMSPEQARGETLDARSDLYSLAAVLYEMVTGAPPFLDRTLANVYARLLTTAAPAASSVAARPLPRELDDVLARALAKTPDERYPTARDFAAALESISVAAPASALTG